MSTGLTFGTISTLYGFNNGIINRAQFSTLITAVILSAIIPTLIAQRFFSPPVHKLTTGEEIDVEDEEFAPTHGSFAEGEIDNQRSGEFTQGTLGRRSRGPGI
jgi:hypothetical protein